MKTMKTIGIIIAALALLVWLRGALCAQQAAPAENNQISDPVKAVLADFKLGSEPDGFRGMKWGTGLSNFSELEQGLDANIGERKITHYTKKNEDLDFLSIKTTEIRYVFSDGKLYGVSIDFIDRKEEQWSMLAKALFGEYGEVEELILEGKPAYIWAGDKVFMRLKNERDDFYLDIWTRYLVPKSETKQDKFQDAVQLGDLAHIQEMLDADPSLSKVTDDKGKSMIQWAVDCHSAKRGEQTIELLISKGADINAKDKEGNTPLFRASLLGMLDLAKYLVSKGADVNMKAWQGGTALTAAGSSNKDVAEFLISKGADVNAKGYYDRTILHDAATWGETALMKLVISKGADVNARDKDGWTPLHSAVSLTGNKGAVEILLANKADVNARESKSGRTALHIAIDNYRDDAVKLLLAANADVNVKDIDGATPLKYAVDNDLPDIVDLLKQHGGHE